MLLLRNLFIVICFFDSGQKGWERVAKVLSNDKLVKIKKHN